MMKHLASNYRILLQTLAKLFPNQYVVFHDYISIISLTFQYFLHVIKFQQISRNSRSITYLF
jgi:hypothetical protein